MKHSELPWEAIGGGCKGEWWVVNQRLPSPKIIAICQGTEAEAKAHAVLIATACNRDHLFDELVEIVSAVADAECYCHIIKTGTAEAVFANEVPCRVCRAFTLLEKARETNHE